MIAPGPAEPAAHAQHQDRPAAADLQERRPSCWSRPRCRRASRPAGASTAASRPSATPRAWPGGVLTLMELTDVTGSTVYATASGPIDVGGFLRPARARSVQKNHPTVGTRPRRRPRSSARCPRELVTDHGWLYLDAALAARLLREPGAHRRVDQRALPAARPRRESDGRTVKVRVPEDLPESEHVAYVDSILAREIEPATLAMRDRQRAHRHDRDGRRRAPAARGHRARRT